MQHSPGFTVRSYCGADNPIACMSKGAGSLRTHRRASRRRPGPCIKSFRFDYVAEKLSRLLRLALLVLERISARARAEECRLFRFASLSLDWLERAVRWPELLRGDVVRDSSNLQVPASPFKMFLI